jgi:hypothetical protein
MQIFFPIAKKIVRINIFIHLLNTKDQKREIVLYKDSILLFIINLRRIVEDSRLELSTW